jgi:sugar phosphate isomerase/epimerase
VVRIGVFSDDLHSQFAPAARIAASAGVDGLAVRNVGGRNVAELDRDEVDDIAMTARSLGLQVASLGSQIGRGWYATDAGRLPAGLATLHRLLDHAEILDAGLIRVFALWLPGQEALSEWSRRPVLSDDVDRIADRLRPLADLARSRGRRLMIELEGASYAGRVAEAQLIIEAVDSPALALCWDVCNGWWSGESARDGYALLDPRRLVDVQTKDVPARADDPSRPTFGRAVVGEGDVGYDWLLPALMESGYEGWITAERVHHPKRPEDEPTLQAATLSDIAALRRIVRGEETRHA